MQSTQERINQQYREVFDKMPALFEERIQKELYPAMGFSSNLDLICDFQIDILNELLEENCQGENLMEMKPADAIATRADLARTITFFCVRGVGGEVDVADPKVFEEGFKWHNAMGGTCTQAAMALSTTGCPSIVHLTDDSKEVCDILNTPYIYTVSDQGELIHTDQVIPKADQEIHYIIQFQKGLTIRLGDQEVVIPTSNRMVLTKSGVNEFVPLNMQYFKYIEEHADHITSNVLSSFNCLQDLDLLAQRLDVIKEHLAKYRKANPKGIVFFEDAHYHNASIRRFCQEMIYSCCDIVSMNEEELSYSLDCLDFSYDLEDIDSVIKAALFIRQKFGIMKGVVIHTANYAMYVGDRLEQDIMKGLICGNLYATGKSIHGWYANREQIRKLLDLDLSAVGLKAYEQITAGKYAAEVVLAPSKYLDKPQYTIGLGDSFVAGVQTCF